MLIGYVRVSKSDGSQVVDLQRDALLDAGVESDRIYEDRASGRKENRPGLATCLKSLQPGNTLVVWKTRSPRPRPEASGWLGGHAKTTSDRLEGAGRHWRTNRYHNR